MVNIKTLHLIRAREFLLEFAAKNPLFYCLVLFYLQRKRAQNVMRAGDGLLHQLAYKYPYHTIAYQIKLSNQYSPFPSSLQISLSRHLPALSPVATSPTMVQNEPEPEELEILHALLDAIRTIHLLDLYIPLTLGLIAFSTLGALLFI